LENPGEAVIKIQKSRGKDDQKTLENQWEGVIKRQKMQGGGHKIMEIPRGAW
jgi:hypothetical protein